MLADQLVWHMLLSRTGVNALQDGNLRHTVYYPTPAALKARVQLAEQQGAGLSIWELGQGMDSFLDLL